jgi:regulatory protein
MTRATPKPLPEPTETWLHEAALRYLSRYAATQTGLLRVLDRRIARWGASADGDPDRARDAKQAARRVVDRLAASGAVDDQAFAQARTRSLRRAGKSARAIGAHLSAKGVAGGRDAPSGDEGGTLEGGELGAAAIHVRRRRLGPFRVAAETPEIRRRELASLARAGFPRAVAAAALRLSQEEAEALIIAHRDAIG